MALDASLICASPKCAGLERAAATALSLSRSARRVAVTEGVAGAAAYNCLKGRSGGDVKADAMKRKRIFAPMERPGWAGRAPYHMISIPEPEYLARRYLLLNLFDADGETRALWARYLTCEREVAGAVEQIEWAKSSPWELAMMLDAAISLSVGVATFLPPGADHVWAARRRLFKRELIIQGLVAFDAGEIDHPLLPAARATVYGLVGGRAKAEVFRRGAEWLGFLELSLVAAIDALDEAAGGPFLEELIEPVVERAEMGWEVRKVLGLLVPPDVNQQNKRDELRVQVYGRARKLSSSWAATDPVDLIARAIAGERDGLVYTGLSRRLRDEARRRGELVEDPAEKTEGERRKRDRRRRKFEVRFNELQAEQEPSEKPELGPDSFEALGMPPDLIAHLAEYLERLARGAPHVARVVAARLEGATFPEIAGSERVTEQTIRNWLKKLDRP